MWSAATAALASVITLCAPALGGALHPATRPDDFAGLLDTVCAVSGVAAATWLWLTTTQVALALLRGRHPSGRVGPLRAVVLTACGVVVLSQAGPAGATPSADSRPPAPAGQAVLAGLPLPDRALDGPATADPTVTVHPGDCLWDLAARRLGRDASDAQITAYWHRIHRRNRGVIGDDPDLIQSGQVLHLPSTGGL